MRKSRIETAETRRRIVETAARQFRRNGIHATGLSDVMSEAGLTNGGFYRHFESKDHLVAEACESGFASMVDAFQAASNCGNGKEDFKAIVDIYVSTEHRDNPDGGCPLAGIGSELARADDQTRETASKGFDEMVDVLAKRMESQPSEATRSDAVFALVAMIGALTVSRIIADPDASASVLQSVKQHLSAL